MNPKGKMSCAYQGTIASYSQIAIERYFPDAQPIGMQEFEDVFLALEQDKVEFAAIPVENSLIGPIIENLDLLAQHSVNIVGEVNLPINHCLIGKKGQKIEEIGQVFSHPKALAQCRGFFKAHPHIKPALHFDTAGAAKDIANNSDCNLAAIASSKTADTYGLEILKTNLEDDQSNTTRFLFVQKKQSGVGQKCSLAFTLNHTMGALHAVLSILMQEGANLTQIVSRPIKNRPFEYLFFIDFLSCKDIPKLMSSMIQVTQTLKFLGCYEPSH